MEYCLNPANNYINIKIEDSNSSIVKTRITDIQGRVLSVDEKPVSASSFQTQYSTAHLAPGSYRVEVLLDDGFSVHELVISR